MSVILTLADWASTQSFTGIIYVSLTNSGSENVKNIRPKVTDTVVFDSLYVYAGARPYDGSSTFLCLNQYLTAGRVMSLSGGAGTKQELQAGATKTAEFTPHVKASAPVQVHNLTCDFIYEVY